MEKSGEGFRWRFEGGGLEIHKMIAGEGVSVKFEEQLQKNKPVVLSKDC